MRSSLLLIILSSAIALVAQTDVPTTVPTSVNATIVLDAAGPDQRKALKDIYLIACPTGTGAVIGTGFLIDSGIIVTNAHVVGTCDDKTLFGISTTSDKIHFNNIIKDTTRNLALLLPSIPIKGGFKLAVGESIEPGTEVSTWGYPFYYNGISPLLSVGYISGYRLADDNGGSVKHIIVNGAFNHGNSGGPLLVSRQAGVIGIVVSTSHFYSQQLKDIIDGLLKQQSGLMVGTRTDSDGSKHEMSEAQVTATALNEFYEKTQVMISEAIAVSELKAFMEARKEELPTAPGKPAQALRKQ